jgi:hypothetical protein
MFDEEEVVARFDSVTDLTEDQQAAVHDAREGFKSSARWLIALCPSGRSLAVALTHLEDASHHAIKAITHGS